MSPVDYISAALNFVPSIFKWVKKWWKFNQPAGKVLGNMIDNENILDIFVKDLFCPKNTIENPQLISQEGSVLQNNPNIFKVWPEVEAEGLAQILNLLGRLDKKDKISIIPMSKGFDQWNNDMIVLGAQAYKCIEFYKVMKNVGYSMDSENIYDKKGNIIERENGYGYGLIIKAKNPTLINREGAGILLGGFGTLGTEAAIYYFVNNIEKIGKEFGKKYFSIIVRARINSGKQSVEKIKKYDKTF